VQWLLTHNNELARPDFPRFDVLSEVDLSGEPLDRSGLLHYGLKHDPEISFFYVPYDNPDDDCQYFAEAKLIDSRLSERLADAGVRAGLFITGDSGGYWAEEAAEVKVRTQIECPGADPTNPPPPKRDEFDAALDYMTIPVTSIGSYRALEKGPLRDNFDDGQTAVTWTITLQ
jgi:hypothetical protein